MAGRIYSLGYEGLTLEGMVDRLSGAGVSTLIDVRLTPVSRKPGFSKSRLAAALAEAGIDYVHERELGNPPENRDSFRDGDGSDGRERMREILSNGAGEALDRVISLASTDRIAILCVEREHQRCHRDVITEMAVERNPDIEVLQVL
jgi:uncharacterized protein (DUF488 family)